MFISLILKYLSCLKFDSDYAFVIKNQLFMWFNDKNLIIKSKNRFFTKKAILNIIDLAKFVLFSIKTKLSI